MSLQVAGDRRIRKHHNILWSLQESAHKLLQIQFASKYTMSTCTQYCQLLTQIPNVNTYKFTILMQRNDIEVNPGPTHKSITTVQGNFHQGDQKEFQSMSAGKQCVTNSIMAIIYSTVLPIKYWEPKHLREILRIGDRLYRRINSPHYYLLVSDIPDVVTEFGKQYSVQRNGEMSGPISRPLPNKIYDSGK